MSITFIDKNKIEYKIKQEDIYDFCKRIYEKEIENCTKNNDINKLNEYKTFIEKYKTFNPYFDFVMFKLDFIYITPLNRDGIYIKADKDLLYSYRSLDDGKIWGYKCDDETLNIKKVDLDNIHNSFIDRNGISYGTEYCIHEVIVNTLLNNFLINNPSMEKQFYDLWEEINYNPRLPLLEIFGYLYVSVDSRIKVLLYNPILTTDKQREIIFYIKEYLYSYIIDYCKLDEKRKQKIKQFMKGVDYEN